MSLLRALAETRSFPLQAAVALCGPRRFLRRFYARFLPPEAVTPGRLFGTTLSFDIDREGDVRALPELLPLLRDHGLRPGFACIGAWVERYPAEHRALAEAGYELINHTQHHPCCRAFCPDRRFDELNETEMREEVVRAHDTIRNACGVAPAAFRSPHFGEMHTDAVYPILEDLGYRCSSSRIALRSPGGGLPLRVGKGDLVEFPVSTCPAHPHSVLDSWHALERRRPWHASPGALVATVGSLLALARAAGAYVNLYFDPAAVVALPDRDALLALFAAAGDGGPATYGEMIRAGRYLPSPRPPA